MTKTRLRDLAQRLLAARRDRDVKRVLDFFADGHSVRVMSRNIKGLAEKFSSEDFEHVSGDVDEPASLEVAMKECTGVHVNIAGGADWDLERRGATNTAQAAAKLGLSRLTYVSGASAVPKNTWFPMTKAKVAAQDAIAASSVPYTIFKATFFMETLVRFVQGNRAMIMGKQPNRFHMPAAADYARMVSKAFTTPEAAGESLYVYGPEAITIEDFARSR